MLLYLHLPPFYHSENKLKPMRKIYFILIKLRSKLLVFLTHNMALPVLRFIRRPQVFPFTAAELQRFEPETLGY